MLLFLLLIKLYIYWTINIWLICRSYSLHLVFLVLFLLVLLHYIINSLISDPDCPNIMIRWLSWVLFGMFILTFCRFYMINCISIILSTISYLLSSFIFISLLLVIIYCNILRICSWLSLSLLYIERGFSVAAFILVSFGGFSYWWSMNLASILYV